MPIYEYVCKKCGWPFEALVRGGQRVECPQCGSRELSKQFSVPAAHRKETGGRASSPSAPSGFS